MTEQDERPAKRLKIERLDSPYEKENLNKIVNPDKGQHDGTPTSRSKNGFKKSGPTRSKSTSNGRQTSTKTGSTFTQPSAMCSGDKGIFVSSDKGREKKCLIELHDIVQEYLEQRGIDPLGQVLSTSRESSPAKGIEDDIAAELSSMREKDTVLNSNFKTKPLQLITLDVPCVSFLRFPPGSALDPVDMVHDICLSAMDNTTPQRSRFVKRLTPVLSLGKTLSQGLQKACDEVLPSAFGPNADGEVAPCTFAIRPTIRNNDKLDRDEAIKMVAGRVQELGHNKHKVDLKQYQKGILVEVYRGWVAMSVVDNADTSKYRLGFEHLKRFNLAEIYTSRQDIGT